jgi:hypothetical protein
MTYDDLIALIPVTLMAQNRTLADPTELQRIVRRAEDEIIERIDHDAFRARLSGKTVTPGNGGEIDLTQEARRVLEVRALQLVLPDGVYPLERREVERLNALYLGSYVGQPRYYAEDDIPMLLRVFPAPDQTYSINVSANIEPERLSPVVQQSVLTRSYPRLLEMCALKHGAHFMRNPSDEQRYGALTDAALMEANTQLARRRRDETAVTTAQTANRVG